MNQIVSQNGKRCLLTEENCIDDQGNYLFRNAYSKDSCTFDSYTVFYDEPAIKLEDQSSQFLKILYTVTSQDTTFGLAAGRTLRICGYTIINTENPQLFITKIPKGSFFETLATVRTKEMYLFVYEKSKFVYGEKHLKTQIKALYQDVITQKCNPERQLLANRLTLALDRPDNPALVCNVPSGHYQYQEYYKINL